MVGFSNPTPQIVYPSGRFYTDAVARARFKVATAGRFQARDRMLVTSAAVPVKNGDGFGGPGDDLDVYVRTSAPVCDNNFEKSIRNLRRDLVRLIIGGTIFSATARVPFTPDSGHERSRTARPLRARKRLMHCNIQMKRRPRSGFSEIQSRVLVDQGRRFIRIGYSCPRDTHKTRRLFQAAGGALSSATLRPANASRASGSANTASEMITSPPRH